MTICLHFRHQPAINLPILTCLDPKTVSIRAFAGQLKLVPFTPVASPESNEVSA
jgi:hypothetical protein